MSNSFIEEAIASARPFTIHTASGKSYRVPHADFIHFSTKRTTVYVSVVEDGKELLATIPLLTVSSVEREESAA